MRTAQTSLGLIRFVSKVRRRAVIAQPPPEAHTELLVRRSINPTRMRKGKSGELSRKDHRS